MDNKQLLKLFGNIYNSLYNMEDAELATIIEADYSDVFGDAIKEDAFFRDKVHDVVRLREDYFTSDRERAAMVLAYKIMDRREMYKRIAKEGRITA